MRRVVVTEFLSLDGVMEEPSQWQQGYGSPESSRFKRDELFAAGALLPGRVTYQGFVQYWPGASETGEFGERMNALPKHVATTTLRQLEWQGAQVLVGEVAEAVRALKAQDGADLLVYGSATLVQTLMEYDLVDLYRFLVYPLVLGEGKRLFREGQRARLKLTESRRLPGGVQLLCYEPDRGPQA